MPDLADRIRELEAALAAEKLAHEVTHQGRIRDVRFLEDALEAETTLRREAEEEVERLRAENRELKMQAIVDHGQFQEAAERLPDLADPIAVHRNMLAGTIAKPSVEGIIHVYGHKALNAALRETDGLPPEGKSDA